MVILKGVEHMPIAKDEVQVVLMEPKSTLNVGDTIGCQQSINQIEFSVVINLY